MSTEEDDREEKFKVYAPDLVDDLHSDVVGEVKDIWTNKRPWTKLRVLRKGVDNPEGQSCGGSQGNFHLECYGKVEAVQYNIQGHAQFYCEKHALLQADWDVIFSGPPKPTPPLTEEQKKFIEKLLEKKKTKKEREEEREQEYDP